MLIYLQMLETEEDKAKFEQIYKAYRGLMYSVAYQKLRQKQDAEDVVHHCFMKLIPYVHDMEEPVSQSTKRLIMTIVEHKIVDELRVRGRHPLEPMGEGAVEIDRGILEGDQLAVCIMKLPLRQRQVLCLKYDQGFSLHEIAKLLDISLCCAQKTDQRAKKKLAELLEEVGR